MWNLGLDVSEFVNVCSQKLEWCLHEIPKIGFGGSLVSMNTEYLLQEDRYELGEIIDGVSFEACEPFQGKAVEIFCKES